MQKRASEKLITILIVLILLIIIIFISYVFYKYFSFKKNLSINANIEEVIISENGKTAYVKFRNSLKIRH